MSPETVQALKQRLIGAGFAVLKATRLHARAAQHARGQGAILTFHRVCPATGDAFAPNRLLEITPGFLDAALAHAARLGFEFVSLDEAVKRIGRPDARPFLALTFDDGYRDTLDAALPILEKHSAPFTLFVTTGFVERTARLWWVELEEAIRRLDQVVVDFDGVRLALPTETVEQKWQAHRTLYWTLRAGSEERLLAVTDRLRAAAGLAPQAIANRLCLDREGIDKAARHPLCTIGAHTVSHPRLAKLSGEQAKQEMLEARRLLETWTGLPVRHLSYPVGDPTSAGPREFALAAELGFTSAVTTRPGMIFPEHQGHLTALPRVSINGDWQSLDNFEVLLSGVPFMLWNRGRKVA